MSDDRLKLAQQEFLEKHKDADELEFSSITKHCISAIYYSPEEKFIYAPQRRFFQMVREEEERRAAPGDSGAGGEE